MRYVIRVSKGQSSKTMIIYILKGTNISRSIIEKKMFRVILLTISNNQNSLNGLKKGNKGSAPKTFFSRYLLNG